MNIPVASNFPQNFDSDENLFLVHDFLRARLVEDYNPGDKTITVQGDLLVLSRFPPNGLITLTEQCSDIDERAISFHYDDVEVTTGFGATDIAVFSGLNILDGFTDVKKPAKITNLTMNVMAMHHNHLKDALIAIEEFIGIKGTEDVEPLGTTLEGRINFLRRLVLQPKAWFAVNKRTGIVPLEVEFTELAFRLGTDGVDGPITITWDFGDQTTSVVSTIEASSRVPDQAINVLVRDTDAHTITKVYHSPGIYTVSMIAANKFGEDVVTFTDLINARVKAPDEAIIQYIQGPGQNATPGVPPLGPFDVVPRIRSPINSLIEIELPSGENPATPGISYGGELLDDSNSPIDPITSWTWGIGDDLIHANSPTTKASFGIGGIYDLKLRVDTEFGAYRITTYEDSIDIIENTNLWLWIFGSGGSNARAYEFGLISEAFKLTATGSVAVTRDDSFLDSVAGSENQKREFRRNVGFAPRGSSFSGQSGTSMLYWASGRGASDPRSSELIHVREFSGFSGTYISRSPITRPWNWANMSSSAISSFLFGTSTISEPPNQSPTNISRQDYNLTTFAVGETTFATANFLNGASELTQNPSAFDTFGESIFGHYSVYRTALKGNVGYIARNDNVGSFFRIKSFYQTEGTTSNPFMNVRKMQDIQGTTKLEGELVDLMTGVYFLDNSGSVSKFNPTTTLWTTGGPGVNSSLYRRLQDTSVIGFDNTSNTLLAASDHDRRAYISFDYSNATFIRFNELDTTFSALVDRPVGEQWNMGVY
jgi:PKD repeat protein